MTLHLKNHRPAERLFKKILLGVSPEYFYRYILRAEQLEGEGRSAPPERYDFNQPAPAPVQAVRQPQYSAQPADGLLILELQTGNSGCFFFGRDLR